MAGLDAAARQELASLVQHRKGAMARRGQCEAHWASISPPTTRNSPFTNTAVPALMQTCQPTAHPACHSPDRQPSARARATARHRMPAFVPYALTTDRTRLLLAGEEGVKVLDSFRQPLTLADRRRPTEQGVGLGNIRPTLARIVDGERTRHDLRF